MSGATFALRHPQSARNVVPVMSPFITVDPSDVMRGGRTVSTGLSQSRVARLAKRDGGMTCSSAVFAAGKACPNCGHINTSDFKDEGTVVENEPRKQADLKSW